MPYERIPAFGGLFFIIILALVVWTIPWKGVALWKAARNSHKVWFIVMLLVNTVAILEIIYIFGYSKKNPIVAGSPVDSQKPNPVKP